MYFYFVKLQWRVQVRFILSSKKFNNSWGDKTSVVDYATNYVTSVRLSVSEHPPPPLIAEDGNQNNVNNNY
jgi:hypothetical protein